MKILYITQFFYPETVAAAFRAYENAKAWVKEGHDVTIFTGYPNFPTGKLFNGYKISMLQKEDLDGIHVLRSKIVIKPNTNKLIRSIAYLSFTFYGVLNMIFNKRVVGKDFDIVLTTSGTVFAPIPGFYYAKKKGIPIVLEIRDLTHKQLLATGSSEKSIGYQFIKWLELLLCKKADSIVSVTNGFKNELNQEGIRNDKINVIPNGVIINEKRTNENKKSCDETIFSYFGTFGISQGLTNIIDFFSQLTLKNKKVKLILIGDGAEKKILSDHTQMKGFKNIQILDSIPQTELKNYYDISDFCLVVLNNNRFFVNTIPSKIFQIMGNAKPVLFFGPKGEASSIIEKAKCGIVLSDVDAVKNLESLTQTIDKLIQNNELDKQVEMYGTNGFDYVTKHYDRNTLAKEYLEILTNTIEKSVLIDPSTNTISREY